MDATNFDSKQMNNCATMFGGLLLFLIFIEDYVMVMSSINNEYLHDGTIDGSTHGLRSHNENIVFEYTAM